MKKNLLFLVIWAMAGLGFAACQEKAEQTPVDDATLEALESSVPVIDDWIFDKRPTIVIHVENPNGVEVQADATILLQTDKGASIATIERSEKVPARGQIDMTVIPDFDLSPGFYKARCRVNDVTVKIYGFGISPFDIVSEPDMQEDFDEFWATALSQLPVLDASVVTLTELPKKSTASCKVYMVEFPSIPDGLEGDPVIVRGYYLEPQDGKKHPVIMHFQGYDTLKNPPKMYAPSGNSGEYAEFYLSHRGQYINHRTAEKRDDGIDRDFVNIYGDWFAFNFGNRDGYYYRGAFMDCVQAVHFMATRETSDMDNLFAEGSSQGGALSYAAAALSDIPFSAIAPNVAFLGDFPDYFQIVGWPANVAEENRGDMTDEQMYAFLSYFDTKNLATRITCAVYATSGLQDGTCPPHTNLAPYNNLPSTDKQMHFYPQMGHSYPPTWTNDIMRFFKERMK